MTTYYLIPKELRAEAKELLYAMERSLGGWEDGSLELSPELANRLEALLREVAK